MRYTTNAPPGADYLIRREAQERAAAAATSDLSARRVHLELASRYAAMMSGDRGLPSAA